MKGNPKFTVFTPTYNRRHTINRVYESLQSQTYRDFEWIVIDDGSSDGTSELVKAWQEVADFQISYQYQRNSGKHVAFNRAVQAAKGELFVPIDSDDGFLPTSLEIMLRCWESIPAETRKEFTGVVCLYQFKNGLLCGKSLPSSLLDTNSLDLKYKYKIKRDIWGFHRTDVLKAFPFPEDPTVRFIPEDIVWDAIARKYKLRCINAALGILYQDSGNQLTKSEPRKKALVKNYFLQMINRDFDYFIYDPTAFAKRATLYVRYSLHLHDWGFMKPSRFSKTGAFALCCLALFPGLLIFLIDNAIG